MSRVQMNSNYRMITGSLYKKRGDAFVHVAVVPIRIKTLNKAVQWFENEHNIQNGEF